jgi:hypothetical protein
MSAALAILAMLLYAVLPACPTEDSTWCGWDGGGNGLGTRYVNLWDGPTSPVQLPLPEPGTEPVVGK